MAFVFVFLFFGAIIAASVGFCDEITENQDNAFSFVDIETCMARTNLPWIEIEEPFLPGETRIITNYTGKFIVAFSESNIVVSVNKSNAGYPYYFVDANINKCAVAPVYGVSNVLLGCYDRAKGKCSVMYSFRDFYLQEDDPDFMINTPTEEEEEE